MDSDAGTSFCAFSVACGTWDACAISVSGSGSDGFSTGATIGCALLLSGDDAFDGTDDAGGDLSFSLGSFSAFSGSAGGSGSVFSTVAGVAAAVAVGVTDATESAATIVGCASIGFSCGLSFSFSMTAADGCSGVFGFITSAGGVIVDGGASGAFSSFGFSTRTGSDGVSSILVVNSSFFNSF